MKTKTRWWSFTSATRIKRGREGSKATWHREGTKTGEKDGKQQQGDTIKKRKRYRKNWDREKKVQREKGSREKRERNKKEWCRKKR